MDEHYGLGEEPTFEDEPLQMATATKAIPASALIDLSISMGPALDALRQAINGFITGLQQEPLTAEFVQFSITTFGGSASTDLPLTQAADPATIVPNLTLKGNGTNFTAGFEEYHRSTAAALKALAADGSTKIQRPNLFVITDGMDNHGGDWRGALAAIRAETWRPNVWAFGFGSADRAIVEEIADPGLAYFAADGKDPVAVMGEILKVMLRSLITISAGVAGGTATAAAPTVDPATHGLVNLGSVVV